MDLRATLDLAICRSYYRTQRLTDLKHDTSLKKSTTLNLQDQTLPTVQQLSKIMMETSTLEGMEAYENQTEEVQDELRTEEMECVIEQWGNWKRVKPRPMPAWGKGLTRPPLSKIPDFSKVKELEARLALKEQSFVPSQRIGRGRGRGRGRNSPHFEHNIAPEVNVNVIQEQCANAFPNWKSSTTNVMRKPLRSPRQETDVFDTEPSVVYQKWSHAPPENEYSPSIEPPKELSGVGNASKCSYKEAETEMTSRRSSSSSDFSSPPYSSSQESGSNMEVNNCGDTKGHKNGNYFVPNIETTGSNSSNSQDDNEVIPLRPTFQNCRFPNWDPDYEAEGPRTWTKDLDFPKLNVIDNKKPPPVKPLQNMEPVGSFKTIAASLKGQPEILDPVSDVESDSSSSTDITLLTKLLTDSSYEKKNNSETLRVENIPREIKKKDLEDLLTSYGATIIKMNMMEVEGSLKTAIVSVKDCNARYVADLLDGSNPFGASSDVPLICEAN